MAAPIPPDGIGYLLHAMPIPAAVLMTGGEMPVVVAANARFARLGMARRCDGPIIGGDNGEIDQALRAMLADPDIEPPAQGFAWRAGDAVSGRHFRVHLARIETGPDMPPACLLSLVDRTAELDSARSLRAELLHDSLTGLPNRIAFTEAVDALVASGDGGAHAVLLVDLARFSRVNESLGAMAGDEVIITVARRLISTLRAGDMLARVGGDEFGVLLRVAGKVDDAIAAGRRIQAVLGNPFRLSQYEIGLECAIGGTLVGADQTSGEEAVRNAQLALKRAKESGRIELHTPGEIACAQFRLDIETELRRAIDHGDLTLAFQPIVDLGANRLVGFEALARWRHPVRGVIDPGEFIPIAEESGLIVRLGRWALERALATLAAWDRAAGRVVPLSMNVNVSAIQLARDDVPAMIAGTLNAYGMSGDRLIVELTESAIVEDPERTTCALNALKSLNVRVAMDDFGTGYSSMSYLRRLPIDILKIDRSFVSGMLQDRDKVAIVRAVLSLADAFGKETTAEGIESIELSQTLAALGCTHGQGYYYSKPLSADDAYAYWRSRND
ncbi:MAG TPA: bifunctional diguanylate cyclase/phosphodiesterase [Sphingomonas sp.]